MKIKYFGIGAREYWVTSNEKLKGANVIVEETQSNYSAKMYTSF